MRVDGAEGGGETSGRKGPEVSMEEMEELVMWSTLQVRDGCGNCKWMDVVRVVMVVDDAGDGWVGGW